jgi:hypothetical protein
MRKAKSVGIYKHDEYSLVGTEYNFIPLVKARSYIDPVWSKIKDEAKRMVEYTSKKEIYDFQITCVEYHSERGTLVHFSGIYENVQYTEGIVPIEKNEEAWINLLKDLETSV